MVPSRMARTLRSEAGRLSFLGQSDEASQPELDLLSKGGLSGCLPTQLPGDVTVGLTRAELKLKWKLKLESSDRV